ncbi:MAG: ribosome biogenesis GTPase Der [Synergistaceae bacterium]|nr:ribosome biogenesis GTPase Der [Synergistaceae bacterium]
MAIITIVGRPNVGKSSLFNRIIGRREAIVDDMPGVTRDRIYGEAEWKGCPFYVIDTGGLLVKDEDPFTEGIRQQVALAMEESDLIVFVIDGNDGATFMDEDVASLLRKSGKPVLLAVNKIDDPKHEIRVTEAYSLGFEEVFGISALHKKGLDALLDRIVEMLPEAEKIENDDSFISVAIVGRPNVGKSSLFNRLAGTDRALVSPVAGTTRDAIDTEVTIGKRKFRIVDTAGLRKKSSINSDIEYYSFVRTLQAIDRSDVTLLIMDASEPCTEQDKKLAAHVVEKGRGLMIILNKWDLLDKENKQGDKMTRLIKEEMVFVNWAPIAFTCALSGRGLKKLGEEISRVYANRQKRIPTSVLNRLMRDVLAFDHLPSDGRGRSLKIYYCLQPDTEPPTFLFFVNKPEIADNAFTNHVRKELRTLEDFSGSPLRVFWRGKEDK